jgi:hypothetical protein
MKNCFLFDIDSTLAKKGDRDIYDDTKLHLDTVIEPVKKVLDSLKDSYTIIIVSGRKGNIDCRHKTMRWLIHNSIHYDKLFMRKEGDNRPDDEVKLELYKEICEKYNVIGVFDDRKSVKRMWVKEGVFVFDVNQLDEEY